MGKKKSGKFQGSGTWLPRELYTSRAYLSLSGFAPQLLILFYGKRDMRQVSGKWVCKNSHSITMTYIELENIFNQHRDHLNQGDNGITRPRIIRAIDELLAKGFIEIVRKGGAYKQDKTLYALSEDWRLWHKGAVFKKRERDTRTRGFRKPKK